MDGEVIEGGLQAWWGVFCAKMLLVAVRWGGFVVVVPDFVWEVLR